MTVRGWDHDHAGRTWEQQRVTFYAALTVYALGLLADWSHWVAIASRLADGGGDHGWVIVTLLFGWIPALVWPVHALAVIWNSDYCAIMFGILCSRIFGS